MTTTTAPAAKVYELDVVGPMTTGHTVRVHIKGCKDAKKDARNSGHETHHTERHTSFESVVADWFGDIASDTGDDPMVYAGEVYVCNCAKDLPTSEEDARSPQPKRTRKVAPKVPVARAARAKVGEYPAAPAELVWTTVDGTSTATGERDLYRVTGNKANGFYAEARMAKGGHWVRLAGQCATLPQAKKLAGQYEAGARWLAYSKVAGTPFAQLPKAS